MRPAFDGDPKGYFIGATGFSVIVFCEFSGPWTWSGLVVIAGAGFYIAVGEA